MKRKYSLFCSKKKGEKDEQWEAMENTTQKIIE
jgi:hypothetical protein